MLELKNPHSALAAIELRPHDVTEIRIAGPHAHGAWEDVVSAASQAGIPSRTVKVQAQRGAKNRGGKTERVGIASALVREHPGVSEPEVLFADAADSAGDRPGLWLALDQLQDPHNVGAIFRTAGFFGVKGVILTKDRSAPLNNTVYDVAAGGLEYTPFCVVPNLSRVLDSARKNGLWTLGTSEHAELSCDEVTADRPWLLVLGNEEKGLRRLTLDKCDQVCAIKPRGGVTSLNVSVAAAVMISRLS
ncbi:MAG: 23S rRNA (guanosine(2251)-2'-O)-methyltransferase RlmB [Planctomycetota bacterium]